MTDFCDKKVIKMTDFVFWGERVWKIAMVWWVICSEL